jgi:hypothetical protein
MHWMLNLGPDTGFALFGFWRARHWPRGRGKRGLNEARPSSAAAAAQGLKRTKIHAAVDALGNSTRFVLTARQAQPHDLEGTDPLLKNTDAQAIIADNAYGRPGAGN